MPKKTISVIGAGTADVATLKTAEEVGRLIAKHGAILICGGLEGVMEAASKGAHMEGGITVGILPQNNKNEANPYIDIPIVTGFGEGRNVIISRSADAIIAIGGEYGTLSEIAFGLKMGKPVIGIRTWDIKGIIKAKSAEDAVKKAFEIVS
ncbi:MAG: TIGR00725 family protein [Thermodesulfovibrionales bacterium]